MLSPLAWPKVITLSGYYCVRFLVFFNSHKSFKKQFKFFSRADIESEEGPGDSACVVSSVLSDTTATTTDQVDIYISYNSQHVQIE